MTSPYRGTLGAIVLASLFFTGNARAAGSYFDDVTMTSFPMQPCGPNAQNVGCYTNFVVFADLNGDGKQDVLFANGGGYYVAGTAQPSVVYFNKGDGTFDDVTMSAFGGPSSRLRQVAVADVDGDGREDVYMPGGYGVDADKLFVQKTAGAFTDEAAARLPMGLMSRAGAAHFGDVDGDGDFDLVVTDWGTKPSAFGTQPGDLHVYVNDGTGVFSASPSDWVPAPLDPKTANTPIDVDLQDVNGDFALDVVLNMRNGQSRLFLNDGTGKLADATAMLPAKQGPYSYNIEACDIDGNGTLDLLIDNAAGDLGKGHRTQVLTGDGKGAFTDVSATAITTEPNSDDNIVKCVDVDDDGDFDLLVGSLTNASEKLLVNDGTGHFTYVTGAIPNVGVGDPTLGLDVADVDGDGVADFVTGQGEDTPRLNRLYKGVGMSAKDTRAPVFRAVETPKADAGKPIVMRVAVSDQHTSEVGQEVTSVVIAWEAGGVRGTVPARFVGGDLFRAEIPAQSGGTTVTLTASAKDPSGNMGTAAPVMVTVTGGGTGGTGGGGNAGNAGTGADAGAMSGSGGDGGASAGMTQMAGAGGSSAGASANGGTSGGQPANGGATAAGAPSAAPRTESMGGCGCAVPGKTHRAPAIAAIALALIAFLRKQRSFIREAPLTRSNHGSSRSRPASASAGPSA